MKKLIIASVVCCAAPLAGIACDIPNCMTVTPDSSIRFVTFFANKSGATIQGGPWSKLAPGSYAWEPKYYQGKVGTIYVGQATYTNKAGKPVEVYGTYKVAFKKTTKNATLALSIVPGTTNTNAACKVLSATGTGVVVTPLSTQIRNTAPVCTAVSTK
ncbi:MAG: hypothetical protein A3E82_04020 [Gammaproteobacteria bacterium RIFCSPHIGHO2_12_FULL_38_11]|nr:MAG: hypothetical protein A3E82_04020 [Gammaproteobacteria bacterium RIFCSPHIGHO2_12_FULL_38_11]